MKKQGCIVLALALLAASLYGCADPEAPGKAEPTTASTENTGETAAALEVDFSQTDADMFTDRDKEVGYDENRSIVVTLSGDTASATDSSVTVDGSTVTLTADATHIIRGQLTGMLIVDAPDTAKLQLVFDGVSIESVTSAALYIRQADKVFLTLAEGTDNALSSGDSYVAMDENNIDAALFSKQDLTVNGTGKLTVTAPAGHGIVCKDDLVMTGGSCTVNAAAHGIDANNSVRLTNAAVTVDAGKDGIHAENNEDASLGFVYISGGSYSIEAEGDGISAAAYAQLQGGSFTVLAGGGNENGTKSSSGNYGGFMGGGPGGMGRPGHRGGFIDTTTGEDTASTSMKGIKATEICISDGSYCIDSADDAIHADGSLTVNGGIFQIATGDDAMHAEETLNVTAGSIQITESYEGLEALHITVSGGDIKLAASDDGLNAAGGTDSSGFTGGRDGMFGGGGKGGMGGNSNGSITISGGSLYVNASGDGIDANGTLDITGGDTVVVGPTSGDTATLDYDSRATIRGGTFIGTGAAGMAQTFSQWEQGVLALQVGSQSAGTAITLTDNNGKVLIDYTPELGFQVVILSTPDLNSGESYTLNIGTLSETVQAG